MSATDEHTAYHVLWSEWDDAWYVVTEATVHAAQLAMADDAPRPPMTFGDLRRSSDPDDIEQLESLLEEWSEASLEHYLTAIERAAGQARADGGLTGRLAALSDVDFEGTDEPSDDYEYLPGDDVDFRDEQIPWDEPEVRYWDVITRASGVDLPADLVERYCTVRHATGSPGSSGSYIGTSVDESKLDELVDVLRSRSHVVVRLDE